MKVRTDDSVFVESWSANDDVPSYDYRRKNPPVGTQILYYTARVDNRQKPSNLW